MTIVEAITYIGIFVFALTGALKARARHLDIFGASVLAFATAYGGGTIRDLLIGIRPINWINDYFALLLIFVATGAVALLKQNVEKFKKTLLVTDAIGLGMFTAGGIDISLSHGVNEVYAVILGVITGTFGGLLADIISNQIPYLLKPREIYATAAAIGGLVYILLRELHISADIRLFVCVALIVGIRLIATWKHFKLPNI